MNLSPIRIARDYNRTLAPPVRWSRIAWTVLVVACSSVLGFLFAPHRKSWACPVALCVLALLALPMDPAMDRFFGALRERGAIRGDLRRELEAIQQFGQLTVTLVIVWAVFLLMPGSRRRLVDWAVGAVALLVATVALKTMVGRARPSLADPYAFVGPAGLYPAPVGDGTYRMVSPWTSSYDLASMPSRHAAFAALAAVMLIAINPRVRPLAITLACVVAGARVILGAHYASDVLVGAALGLAIGTGAVRWGTRAGGSL